jgi:outer membrane protein assembly factor BamD (BamD/ComL family)
MSVAGVLSSFFDSSSQSVQPKKQQLQQEFQQLGKDLQAGNVSSAQQDYSTIQRDLQNGTAQVQAHHHHHLHGGGGGSAISQLFDQLGQALQSGNLTSAQQAYTSLQQDFQKFLQNGGQQSPAPAQSGPSSLSVDV